MTDPSALPKGLAGWRFVATAVLTALLSALVGANSVALPLVPTHPEFASWSLVDQIVGTFGSLLVFFALGVVKSIPVLLFTLFLGFPLWLGERGGAYRRGASHQTGARQAGAACGALGAAVAGFVLVVLSPPDMPVLLPALFAAPLIGGAIAGRLNRRDNTPPL